MDGLGLLEALVRPDNYTAYVLDKGVKFLSEHRGGLARVERSLNSFAAAPVGDGAGDPVQLSLQVPDRVDISTLMRTSDESFNKIMVCLLALCEETSFLRQTAEAKFYGPLALFGHSANDDAEEWGEGLLEAQIGLCLPLLQEAANFVDRLRRVVHALVRQLRAIYGERSRFAAGFQSIKLGPVTAALGDALRTLLTLDAIVRGNKRLLPAWDKFKRLADIMRSDAAKFGVDAGQAQDFEAMCEGLDRGLLRGNTFQAAIDQPFESQEERAAAAASTPASGGAGKGAPPAWITWLREAALERLGAALAGLGSDTETGEALTAVGQYAVYALFRVLVGGRLPAEALAGDFYGLWRHCERLPLVLLWGGRCVWRPDEFLLAHANIPGGPVAKRLLPPSPPALRAAAAEALEASLPALANTLHARTLAWLVRAEQHFGREPLHAGAGARTPLDVCKARAALVLQALATTYAAQRALGLYVAYTLTLERPVRRKVVAPLARLAELCKVLEGALKRHSGAIGEALPGALREDCVALCALLAPLRLKAGGAKAGVLGSATARVLHAASECMLDLCAATESWTPARRVLLELAASCCVQREGLCAPKEVGTLAGVTWNIALLSDWARHSAAAANTSALYHVRELAPGMVASAASMGGEAPHDLYASAGGRLPYLLAALSDPARWLAGVAHLPPPPPPERRIVGDTLQTSGAGVGLDGVAVQGGAAGAAAAAALPAGDNGLAGVEHLLTAYERYLHGILRADLIEPLCRVVERDLREQVHSAAGTLGVGAGGGAGAGVGGGLATRAAINLLALPPFRVVSALVDVRQEVQHYLEKTFYELTTVALHDWKTYGEMASLAAGKYGLELTENFLPMGCLDQGLDVLQIMRNIHVFVARYGYNLNQQFFMEKRSLKGAKHLNVVNTQSISSSIRQHGSGMINTTVNFAYQFLSQKFSVFSQFLYDDYIKSYLAKERRYFRKSRKELNNRYPYDHALALQREIRSLGTTPDKQTFLDKFRGLVTEIGNALGYVRMVRSAGMAATAEAIQFVPSLAALPAFGASARAVEGEAAAAAEAARAAEVEAGGSAASIPTPAGLSAQTLEAAAQLDAVLENLVASFSEGSDFFKMLVSVFQHSLLAPGAEEGAAGGGGSSSSSSGATGDSHLRNFFLIVPALTLSYIDNLRTAKDRMEKSVKGAECFFTDDGFAMGLAYILAILKQDRALDSLHWWDSVTAYHRSELLSYKAELAGLGTGPKASKGDADRREELSFKEARVCTAEVEMSALFYAFSCSRLLFKGDGSREEEEVALSVDKMLS